MKHPAPIIIAAILLLTGCSKKHQPQSTITVTETGKSIEIKKEEGKPESVIKKVVKVPIAKVISVDDRAAKKTPDGRLYYDIEGKRYWKNYNDGRYYLFNKKMYNNPAFTPH